MSWEFNTTPVVIPGYESSSYLCLHSTKINHKKMAALETILYGSEEAEPRLPMPDQVLTQIKKKK